MLTDTIASSVQTIERLRQRRERKGADEQFSSNLTKLSACVEQIQETLNCAEELLACHVSETPVLTKTVLDDLRNIVSDCGNAVNDSSLNADKVHVMMSCAKTAKQELDSSWKESASALFDPLESRLIILRDLSEKGVRIRELEKSMHNSLTSPVTRKQIRAFANAVNEAAQIVNSFPLDAEIEVFLQKVSRRQATLADLTPEVYAWLNEYQFLHKFRIVSS